MAFNNNHRLSETEWSELQSRADRFALALPKGMAGDWDSFLENLDGRMRLAVLAELIKIDLEYRWQNGEKPLLEEYLKRFPDLGPMHHVPVDLVCEEFRVRRKHQPIPSYKEYEERFPAQYEAVIREVEKEVPETRRSASMDESIKAKTIATDGTPLPREPLKEPPAASALTTGYEKLEMIGEGHFADVWRATAPGGVEVAIKVVRHPVDRDAAQRELGALEIVKNLRHPCLLSCFQFWLQDRKLHIAMELADGSLRNRLKICKKQGLPGVPRDELLMYFADAAEGLDFLHSRKVFHRDIKPDNIMLLQGHAKVADFGLARLQEQQMATVSFAGTPVYMAPESWGGRGGPRSDQYSLAFSYAELRQGKRPVEGDDLPTVMNHVLESEPDFSGIPSEEAKILRRAMAKDPKDRFNNCCEFVAAMARATGTPVRIRTSAEEKLVTRGSDASDDKTYKEPSSHNINLDGGWKKYAMAAALLLLVLGGVGFSVWHFGFRDRTNGKPPGGTGVVIKPEPDDDEEKKKKPDERHGMAAFIAPLVQYLVDAQSKVKRPFLYVPASFEQAVGANLIEAGERKFYDKIVRKFNGGSALFILVVPSDRKDKPFYMMENKVWNAFFRSYLPELVRLKAVGEKGDEVWRKEDANFPTRQIDVEAAHHFARLLGGYLPTPRQWEIAAGYYDKMDRTGPTVSGSAAIKLTRPQPINAEPGDVGPLGIRDLAGNGREFTRKAIRSDKMIMDVPIEKPDPLTDKIILRGQSFDAPKALSYDDIEAHIKVGNDDDYPGESALTGFRVVIELPE